MTDQKRPNSFYSETAFANTLGLSKGTVKKMRQSGLYHVRIGRRILFNEESSVTSFGDTLLSLATEPEFPTCSNPSPWSLHQC